MKTKRILSLLLSVLFTISLLPGGTLPVRAEEKIDVTFLIREWNNDTQSITATEMFLSGCTVVESSMTTWDYHTYVVTEDVTISTPITIACYVKLILCDGATLTADGGIIFTENGSLNIYGQSRDSGSLIDATYGRRTRAVIITDSGHLILSAIQTETISNRILGGGETEKEEDEEE